MKAIEFVGQDMLLGPPGGWDNAGEGPKCGALPVKRIRDSQGTAWWSAWRPSPDELAALNAGAHVCLCVSSANHPPVAVEVHHLEELP
jgi:hypothetical protein